MSSFLARWEADTSAPTKKTAARDVLLRAVLPMAAWWLVVVAGGWLLTNGPLKSLGRSEESINRQFEDGRTSILNHITLVFSWVGATASIVGLCLVVVALLWWRTKQWWYSVVPLLAIALQALVFFFATLVIDRERPDVEQLDDSPPTSSYPSGHTGAATALYFSFALMALRIRHRVLRAVVMTVCVAMPFLVAWARLYRGMHHVSDVSVAVLNGLVAVLLAWAWLSRSGNEKDQTRA